MLVGHVTKDGGLAGPRMLNISLIPYSILKVIVTTILRTLQALKNRFGSAMVGLFEMTGTGLREVADPAGWFIDGRQHLPGSCVVPDARRQSLPGRSSGPDQHQRTRSTTTQSLGV